MNQYEIEIKIYLRQYLGDLYNIIKKAEKRKYIVLIPKRLRI